MSTAPSLTGGLLNAVREPDFPMHEDYFGFAEKPFSLTPDPKYLYRSASHGSAFELLQYAIRRREGFVVVTGDIGTGKTTLCRAVLDQLDRKTFTALVLNPFLSEDDLLRVILQDFGVVSRDEIKRGRLAGVTKQELIETLNEFLLSLLPIGAGALLIIDEAQNLPLQTLEQIRILSNLETDKEKLLQIVLVGQPNLKDQLKSPALRQLDQRISIRFELNPLSLDETAAYIGHRLTIAGGGSVVNFSARALSTVYRYSGGIPRLINLLCDRALLGACVQRTNKVSHQIVAAGAQSLELNPAPGTGWAGWKRRWALLAGAIVIAAASTAAYASIGAPRVLTKSPAPAARTEPSPAPRPAAAVQVPAPPNAASRTPDAETANAPRVTATTGAANAADAASYSVVVGSFRQRGEAESLSADLRALGFSDRAIRIRVVTSASGVWHQVLAGPYTDAAEAEREHARVREIPGYADARLIIH